MTTNVTVIIVGHAKLNRMPTALFDPATRSNKIIELVSCSPVCEIAERAAVISGGSHPSGYQLDFLSDEADKPAECYVVQFADATDAHDWLTTDVDPLMLDGKLVLLLDPAAAEEA